MDTIYFKGTLTLQQCLKGIIRNYIWVLSYSHYTTFAGWGVHLRYTGGMRDFKQCIQDRFSTEPRSLMSCSLNSIKGVLQRGVSRVAVQGLLKGILGVYLDYSSYNPL